MFLNGLGNLESFLMTGKIGKKDDPGQFRSAGLTAVPVKFTNKVILRHVEKHLKDRQQNNWSQPAQLHEGQV